MIDVILCFPPQSLWIVRWCGRKERAGRRGERLAEAEGAKAARGGNQRESECGALDMIGILDVKVRRCRARERHAFNHNHHISNRHDINAASALGPMETFTLTSLYWQFNLLSLNFFAHIKTKLALTITVTRLTPKCDI